MTEPVRAKRPLKCPRCNGPVEPVSNRDEWVCVRIIGIGDMKGCGWSITGIELHEQAKKAAKRATL